MIPLVSGVVEEISVSVGDTVSAGDLLCRIDDESAQFSLQSAQASYETVQSAVESAQQNYQSAVAQYGGDSENLPVIEEQVKMAEKNYNDTKELLGIGAAAQIEVDQAYQSMLSAQAGLESAKAGLRAAQSSVSQAQANLQSAQVGIESAEYKLSLYRSLLPFPGWWRRSTLRRTIWLLPDQ